MDASTPPDGPVMMTQAMRWFGPADPVRLRDIRQAGASQVVTALHELPPGAAWPADAVAARLEQVREAGLDWTVVESLPVHDAIKAGGPDRDRLLDAWRTGLRSLAACGVRTVTYNFMPLLDWTRTDLAWPMPDGALALRFEPEALAAFDLHVLRRPGARDGYDPELAEAAGRRFAAMDEAARLRLERAVIAGLPGGGEGFTAAGFLRALRACEGLDADRLRANHVAFLEAVCPLADELGVRLVVHPDDPPFPLFGLPRTVSTEADLAALFAAVPSPSNGLCLCTGSLGARADCDLPGTVERLGDRIGFLHLRSVKREGGGAFHEAAHLEGDADLPAVVAAVHRLQQRTGRSIPMRPDHGHRMLDDLARRTNPGYSLIGRMRGLAELRGLERGIARSEAGR